MKSSDAATPAIRPGGERENPERAERGETSALVFRVDGIAIPQGSMKGYVLPTGQVAITSDNPKLKRWRQTVATAANVERYSRPAAERGLLMGAVALEALFVLPRPKSLPKHVLDPTTRPDLDKLVRAVKDALTGVVWRDDGQVVELRAAKVYTVIGEAPHVDLRIDRIASVPLLEDLR